MRERVDVRRNAHGCLYRIRRRRRRPRLAGKPRLAGHARPGHRARTSRRPSARDYGEVVLAQRLREALARLNPTFLPRRSTTPSASSRAPKEPSWCAQPRGASPARGRRDGRVPHAGRRHPRRAGAGDRLRRPDDNDWLAVNQFTVVENKHTRRPDVVLFVNGLPLAVLELKNAADENATIWTAFQQLQTYKAEMPSLFAHQRAAGGLRRRRGAHRHANAGREWFKPWRTIAGETLADTHLPELQVVIEGVFEKRRFLDLHARLHRLRGRRRAGSSSRRWPAITSSMPCGWRWRRRCGRPSCGARPIGSRRPRALRSRPASLAASPATDASAWSGTRRARARASRWPSMPAASSASRRWRTRPSSCSPTATTSTTSSSAPSRAARTSAAAAGAGREPRATCASC